MQNVVRLSSYRKYTKDEFAKMQWKDLATSHDSSVEETNAQKVSWNKNISTEILLHNYDLYNL